MKKQLQQQGTPEPNFSHSDTQHIREAFKKLFLVTVCLDSLLHPSAFYKAVLSGKLCQRQGKTQEVWFAHGWHNFLLREGSWWPRRQLVLWKVLQPREAPQELSAQVALTLGTQTQPCLSVLLNETHFRKARSRHKNDLSCSALHAKSLLYPLILSCNPLWNLLNCWAFKSWRSDTDTE